VQGATRKVHAGWLVAAIVAGLVAAPAAAIATTQLVRISGSTGSVAQVDPANRLQVSESSPKAYFESGYLELDQTLGCKPIEHVPNTKALMVTQVAIIAKGATFDSDHGVLFARQAGCAGAFTLIHVPTEVGSQLLTLDPPLPIPAGGTISGEAFGSGTHTEVDIRGYFVPKSAVA
jgi:hypothetical protein